MSSGRDRVANRLSALPGAGYLVRQYGFHRSRLHVVSYPKSGRTWLRFLMGVALQENFGFEVKDPGDLLEINRLARIDRRVPSTRFSHDDGPHSKTVHELVRDKRAYRTKDVVFMVRDPRDVVVSSYYHHTRRGPVLGELPFDGPISEFVRHPVFGVRTIVEFMNIWANNRSVPRRFHLVRYEDAMHDPHGVLAGVLAFAGVEDCSAESIRRSVEAASFERMKELERTNALGTWRLRPTDPDDAHSFKVRSGRVGGYRTELAKADIAYVDEAVAQLDTFFGYYAGPGTVTSR